MSSCEARQCQACLVYHTQKRCPACDAAQRVARGKPGAELEKIIPAFFADDGCGCRSYARKMDRWGVEGCRKRHAVIVKRLVREASKVPVIRLLGPVNKMVAQEWVSRAIANAEQERTTSLTRP